MKIDLGKDREPIYAVDDITGQVYYLTGEKELTLCQFIPKFDHDQATCITSPGIY